VNAPYFESFSLGVYLTLAVVIGFFFGFFLERAGFSSARKLTGQFYFRDWSVLKVMFTAIVTAMLGLGYLSALGWIDMSLVYIPPTYVWPQLLGGLLLGTGFIMGGYCPGTSVVAAVVGRLDALFFLAGIVAGGVVFGLLYPAVEEFYVSGSLGTLTLPEWLDLNVGIVILAVVAMAVGAFWVAEKSEGEWDLFAKTYGKSTGEGNE